MKRRRFLQIFGASALCATAGPGRAQAGPPDWVGRGFGAELSLRLDGKGDRQGVVEALPHLIAAIEADFSLFDPQSALSRLNRGESLTPSPAFRAVLDWTDALHQITHGAFDPSIQGIWQAHTGGAPAAPPGWSRVPRSPSGTLKLPDGMVLTFNGLVQGYAADAVRVLLSNHGFDHALVDMGEFSAIGGPWHIGLTDPAAGFLAAQHVKDGAVATSSPLASLVAGHPHLIHPKGLPALWSTVSVEADRAILADGFSTAAVFFGRETLRDMLERVSGLRRITLIDFSGNLTTLDATT